MCDDPEWINGLSYPIVESYHPNSAGHASGYTPAVSPLLTGATVTAGPALERRAVRTAPAQAATQRQYAALDAAIEPKPVEPVDLHGAEARRAAARAGVDVDDPASVAAADRRADARQLAARGERPVG
ncbi:hypothetical protein [Phycicoccus avicenniae]|uniref:hypothetical protein n=1 Tax=Phycicoccus avicenniae TaxID=2828860 RepID=UPI002013A429|nr:hypothetical protein [Phycicoccus avicenniae]